MVDMGAQTRPDRRLLLGLTSMLAGVVAMALGIVLLVRADATPERIEVMAGLATEPGRGERAAAAATTRVLAISVDGLNPHALGELGKERAPHLLRLFRQGAGTRNARSQVEQTVTLPNHTSMVTGRRIDADHNGHGVTWNHDAPGTTVHEAAGEDVSSVFREVDAAGGSTAFFATESKFSVWERSWTVAIDRSVIRQDGDAAVTRLARRDLVGKSREFTFLHLGVADETGHAHGWMSEKYLSAIETVDGLVGSVLRTIRKTESLAGLVIVLTADHGGPPGGTHHDDPQLLANYRVPFVIWGPGVTKGDLYEMNEDGYADPGDARVKFKGTQPVRNGDLANLALDILGIGKVPQSRWNRKQTLAWN